MKIYEWKNILCPQKVESFLDLSTTNDFADVLKGEDNHSYKTDDQGSSRQYHYIMMDFNYLLGKDVSHSINEILGKLEQGGRLIIYEDKANSLWKRRTLKKKLRHLFLKDGQFPGIAFREIVSIPDVYNPKCLYSREDNCLQPYVFGHFLLSYDAKKRMIYNILYFMSLLKLNSLIDNLFASVVVVDHVS